MIIFKQADAIQNHIELLQKEGRTIGFIPTMGALHKGHLSLIEQSKQENDITVCSIFVNPTQFNDVKDFEKYPVTIEKDIALLEKKNTDILFFPSVNEMYPKGTDLAKQYDLGFLETILEGRYRPCHFQGVCQVVHRLLDIVPCDKLYLGQKDYQQCMVLQRLIQILNLPVHIVKTPTEREPSGLAMSSRNTRLSPDARQKAVAIYQMLTTIQQNIHCKDIDVLLQEGEMFLLNSGFDKIDYIAICDADTLAPVSHISEANKLVALTAAFIEGVRLIDNVVVVG